MQCSIQDRSAHYIFQAREEHPKLVDEFLNLATERLFQCLLSDQFKKKIFDGTANSMKLTVENKIKLTKQSLIGRKNTLKTFFWKQ